MKIPILSAIVLSGAVLGFADGATAQQARKLFFEGDLVRHPVADQAGPFCVLANQFKRKEAVAWRIRVLLPNGNVADDKVLKTVVVRLGNGQTLHIVGDGAAPDAPYVQSMTVDGQLWSSVWIDWSRLASGATLEFSLSSTN